MATTSGPFLDPENTTHVKDMPPVVVTTTGIPETEHLPESRHVEVPPQVEKPSHTNRWVALALAGVLTVSLGAIAYVVSQPVPDTNLHMGLSATAWSDYRAGERAAIALAGPSAADWQTYRTGERASTVTSGPGSVDWQTYRAGERG
jgi:hypothetical protein